MTTKSQKQEKLYKEELKNKKKQGIRLQWDGKSTIITISIVAFLALFYFAATTDIRGYFIQKNKNWIATVGEIQSIEKITGVDQSRTGNKIKVTGYKIAYKYSVNGIDYKKENIGSSNLFRFVSYIYTLEDWKVEVYYKKTNPDESYLNTDLKSKFYNDEH